MDKPYYPTHEPKWHRLLRRNGEEVVTGAIAMVILILILLGR